MTLACVAAAVGLTTPVPASGQGTEQKYALLIGLSQYRQVSDGIVQLSYPDEDVTALTSVLVGQNFQVVSLIDDDAKREDIIQELYHHAEMVRKQDTFLLYFSGHGVRNDAVNGKTYWLTYDAGLAVLDTAGIRIEHLLEYVQDIKAERKIVLLDHCFSGDVVTASSPEITTDAGGGGPGAGARTTGGGRRIAARGVFRDDDWYAEAAPHATGLVMLAAAKDRAFESPTLKHGLFTAALLRALGSRDADTAPRNGRLSANELISFVRTKVAALAAAEGFPPQQPRAFGVGAELDTWELASSLPADDLDEAKAKLEVYKRTLGKWENSQWITLPVKLHCKRLLETWIQSIPPDGIALGEDDVRVLGVVRNHLDMYLADPGNSGRERDVAVDLEDTIAPLLASGAGGGQ